MMNRGMMNPILYSNDTPQPVGAGIYHSPSLGLISLSSDGETRITIADKNLGATQVYNDGDELTQDNCGNYYQWGNCYGFPFTGNITTSSTRVNVSSYGPNNYYSSSSYVTPGNNNSWMINVNNDLWGGETGTKEARQGPCPDGFHIFTKDEFDEVINEMVGLDFNIRTGGPLKIYLKMPFAGYRGAYGGIISQGTEGVYWTCIHDPSSARAYCVSFTAYSISIPASSRDPNGASIRPFKNEPVIPDNTRIKLY